MAPVSLVGTPRQVDGATMAAHRVPCFPVGKGRIYGDLIALALVAATVVTLVAQFGR